MPKKDLNPKETFDRFMKYVSPEPNSGCWLWIGGLAQPQGYGRFAHPNKRDAYAHRVSYEMFVGSIPVGYHVDHLCRVRCCVNPKHLESVTQQVNIRRGSGGAHNRIKDACPKGHPYSGDNLLICCVGRKGYPNGFRSCRACSREETRRRRAEGRDKWVNSQKYRARDKVKERAHGRVNDAIAAGKLKRLPCENCGATPSKAHHEDYSRPLEVVWLCAKCHRRLHAAIDKAPIRHICEDGHIQYSEYRGKVQCSSSGCSLGSYPDGQMRAAGERYINQGRREKE